MAKIPRKKLCASSRLTQIKINLFNGVVNLLRGNDVAFIKGVILTSDLSVLYLLFDLALKSGDQEVCTVIKEVIAERGISTAIPVVN